MGTFAQNYTDLEKQHKQVIFLPPAVLEQVKKYKVANEITSLSQACYELVKLGLDAIEQTRVAQENGVYGGSDNG